MVAMIFSLYPGQGERICWCLERSSKVTRAHENTTCVTIFVVCEFEEGGVGQE